MIIRDWAGWPSLLTGPYLTLFVMKTIVVLNGYDLPAKPEYPTSVCPVCKGKGFAGEYIQDENGDWLRGNLVICAMCCKLGFFHIISDLIEIEKVLPRDPVPCDTNTP